MFFKYEIHIFIVRKTKEKDEIIGSVWKKLGGWLGFVKNKNKILIKKKLFMSYVFRAH